MKEIKEVYTTRERRAYASIESYFTKSGWVDDFKLMHKVITIAENQGVKYLNAWRDILTTHSITDVRSSLDLFKSDGDEIKSLALENLAQAITSVEGR